MTKPWKIGIACHSFRTDGGMGRYVQDLTDGLLQLGFKPVIFTKKIDRTLPNADKVEFVHINCKWLPSKLRDYYYNSRLGTLRRKHGIDVMISCNRNTHSDIAVCGGTHLGYLRAMNQEPGFFDRKMIELEKAYYARSGLVVAHSNGMYEELLELYGLSSSKCETIYPPVSERLFSCGSPAGAADLEKSPDRYYFVIPSAGNHAFKGLDLLTTYFERTQLPVTLWVAGRPIPSESAKVRHIGFRKDMPDVYRRADFTILSSRYEPFGLVGIESVACGTPVVLSGKVCSGEVIDEAAKTVFDVRSFESFESAVKQAIERFGRKKLENPARYLHVTTSTKEHVEALLSAYERVTGQRRS